MDASSKKLNSEIERLEREKEGLVKEKSALLEKIGDKKRKISALRKQLRKVEKTDQKARSKKRTISFFSLKIKLYLPVLTLTIALSLIYANAIVPFASLDFVSTYYPLATPFIIFFISLICLIVSIFYFALYQLVQNYKKAKVLQE